MSRVDIVIGPTASGKTSFAIDHAHRHDGVVINADSMQIYNALPILTAQPDAAERTAAEHRLYACLPPSEFCGAGRWRDLVIPEIETVLQAGKRPILVGGSGFYINALLRGFSPIPDIPVETRLSIEGLAQEERYQKLCAVDPVSGEKLNANDSQRVTRALEVFTHTGTRLSDWQKEPLIPPPDHYDFHIISLLPDRQAVYAAINARVAKMVDMGVMEEVKTLSDQIDNGTVAEYMPIVKAHGFRPFRKVLKGESTMEEAINRTAQETRNYAKRQYTWARHQVTADEVIA